MTGQLRVAGEEPEARCKLCGALAVGPCAHCRGLVCGDCCVLTEGGVKTWAICLTCDRKKGRSLLGGWALVLTWVGIPIALLAAFGVIVGTCR